MTSELAMALQAYPDPILVQAVLGICAERPTFCAMLVEGLQQGCAGGPSNIPQRFIGTIKKFDNQKKFGFIFCPEVSEHFGGRHIFLSNRQVGNFKVGDRVSFVVTLGREGSPQAQELEPAPAEIGQLPESTATGVAVVGAAGPAPTPGTLAVVAPAAATTTAATTAPSGSPVASNLGGSSLSMGAQGGSGVGPPMEMQGPGQVPTEAPSEPPVAKGPPPPLMLPEGRFPGIIKSFDLPRHCGFIDCIALDGLWGRDVFVHESQAAGFSVGARVSLLVNLNNGRPHAQALEALTPAEVRSAEHEGLLDYDAPPAPPLVDMAPFQEASPITAPVPAHAAPPPTKRPRSFDIDMQEGLPFAAGETFIGMIKKFDSTKRYGFIDCPDLHQVLGSDVFVGEKHLQGFQPGSVVRFRVEIKSGKPHAYDLAFSQS